MPTWQKYFVLMCIGVVGSCSVFSCGDEAEGENNLPEPPNLTCVESTTPEDPDEDGDGAADECDNCVSVANPDQLDSDHDGQGNACDDDDDGDGDPDETDNCPLINQQEDDRDSDSDGIGDECDPCPSGEDANDSDADGFNDCVDLCPTVASESNDDTDNDGVGDACDNCVDAPNAGQTDVNDDGVGDACQELPFDIVEASVDTLTTAIREGEISCEGVVQAFLSRIYEYDLNIANGPPINAIISINDGVLEQARDLDERFAETEELVGPLHCVPFVVKTNYGTLDVNSTGGSFAYEGVRLTYDSHTIEMLKSRGALVLASSAMDEFASGVQGIGGRSGKTGNAYNTTLNSGGSSSGSGAATGANMAMAGLGTDNCASLTQPASYNGLSTLRSTLGLVSTRGIMPTSPLDTVSGPMTRSIRDLAYFMDAMAQPDEDDTFRPDDWKRPESFLDSLKVDGLEGKRIGVLRDLPQDGGGYREPFFGGPPEVQKIWRRAMEDMERQGATIVDNIIATDFSSNRYGSSSVHRSKAWIESTTGPHDELQDVCRTGRFSHHIHESVEQCLERLESRLQNPSGSLSAGLEAYDKNRKHFEAIMDVLELDALIFPTEAFGVARASRSKPNCIPYSTSTLPAMTINVGSYSGLPVGMILMGRKWDEPTLFEIAYGYEQATKHRRPTGRAAAPDRSSVSIEDFNRLHREAANLAFEEVLKDGGKFDLNATNFTEYTRQTLERAEFSEFRYLLGE